MASAIFNNLFIFTQLLNFWNTRVELIVVFMNPLLPSSPRNFVQFFYWTWIFTCNEFLLLMIEDSRLRVLFELIIEILYQIILFQTKTHFYWLFRTRREFPQISRDWSSLASSWRMEELCLIIIFRRNLPFTLFSGLGRFFIDIY